MTILIGSSSIRRILVFHCFVALILGVLSLAAGYSWFVLGHDHVYGLVGLLFADSESSFINWYSVCLWFANASLVALVAIEKWKNKDRHYLYFCGLAVLLLYFSADESAMIHELFTLPVRAALGAKGIFFLAWVIPYSILSLVIGSLFVRFLWQIPRRFALLFVASGLLYLSATLGVEMLQSPLDERGSSFTMAMAWMVTIEEVTEILAMAIFNYAILTYIRVELGRVEFIASAKNEEPEIQVLK